MRNNNLNNMKGSANVKNRNEEQIFNSKKAEMIRDESRWDAFQLIGDTNREEMTHHAPREKNGKEMQKVLDRALAFRIGRKIAMVLESDSA